MDILNHFSESTRLRADKDRVLTETSPEVVKGEIALRKRFRVQLREAKAELSRQIAKLQELKRDLDVQDQYQGADIDELDEYKWELLREAKESRSAHYVSPDDSPLSGLTR